MKADKREQIFELSRYMDRQVRVKFFGGREVFGTLKGYDQILNLIIGSPRFGRAGEADAPELPRARNAVVCKGSSIISVELHTK